MIESGVIVYSFILAGIISLICFGAFIWMNLKDRDLDEKLYSKKKDIRNLVSKHRHEGKVEEESIDSLKKYSVSGKTDKEREEEERIREEFSRRGAESTEKDEKNKKEEIIKEKENNETKSELIDEEILTEPKKEISEEDYNKQFKPKG